MITALPNSIKLLGAIATADTAEGAMPGVH